MHEKRLELKEGAYREQIKKLTEKSQCHDE